ncbi:MAG: lipopolysaccharide biosynthesis protein [Betaproteobacteria bacterium]
MKRWPRLRDLPRRARELFSGEGMGTARVRRAILTALASVVAKGVAVATSLITVPLTLDYLGPDRYGVWMSMMSVIAMLTFADLGIGNGIMNNVSSALGREDDRDIRRTLASGLAMLVAVAGLGLAGVLFVYPALDWMSIFNIPSSAAAEDVGAGMIALLVVFSVGIPVGIIQRVQLGLQEGFQNNLWQCAGSVLSLCAVLAVVRARLGLPWLIVAYTAVPLLTQLASGADLLRRRPSVRPSVTDVEVGRVRELAKTGSAFFLLQLGTSIAYASDNLVVAHQLSVREVTDFSVYQKLFSMVPLLMGMALLPLWPAYGEALARRDTRWIRATLRKVTVVSFVVSCVSCLALVALAAPIIGWWVGPDVRGDVLLSIGLSFWVIVDCTGKSIAMFLNGVNMLRPQLLIVLVFVPLCFALKYWMAGALGSAGVPIGVAIAYLVVHVPAYTFLIARWQRHDAVLTAKCGEKG